MTFSPKDVKEYEFELPIKLSGYGKMDSLTRFVYCQGIRPKLLIEPISMEFKRKIITTVEKCYPTFNEMTLSNPSKNEVNWRIESYHSKDSIFTISPEKGKLGAGKRITIQIGFNPYQSGDYEENFPIFLDDSNKVYLEINFKGKASHPKLIFDRNEIILPIVPLGIAAKCVFRIYNDGFENLNLKHMIHQEVGIIDLKLNYLNGKVLGITKKRLIFFILK